jgi:4-hydroxy-2-oxoheptanedioate aldolase
MIRKNPLLPRLRAGEACIGTFVKLTDPSVVEVLALAGFDFIIIDNEHTAMSKESMVALIRAADGAGIPATVRPRENNPAEILQALDAGALGVQVPQVDTKEQARQVVDRVKYAPVGKRGYAASQRSAHYGFMNAREYADVSNAETLVACYCETAEAIRNLDEILTVPEVDVIFIGPFDLSQALGVMGEPGHQKVLDAIAEITRKTRAAGKAVGIIASDAAQAQKWIDQGIQYISLNSDLGMIGALGKRMIGELRGSA